MAPMPERSDVLISFYRDEYPSESSLSFDGSSTYSLPALDPFTIYNGEQSDVQVEVSGVSFVVSISAFQRLARLPWERIHATAYRLDGASPEAFEKIMDYVLFQALPKRKRMSKDEQEEIISLSQVLDFRQLIHHLQEKRGLASKFSKRRRSSLSCCTAKPSDVETRYGYSVDSAKSFTTF
jgi:hypothetical protein